MGCEDFLVASSNADAVAWLDRWPAWPAPALTVYGPAGCGKTHLGHVWRTRSRAVIANGETLDQADLPGLLASANAVVVEDADRVAGKPAREEALFHLYNLAREQNGHLLLLSRKAPSRWRARLADLRSRIKGARRWRWTPPTTRCSPPFWSSCSPTASCGRGWRSSPIC